METESVLGHEYEQLAPESEHQARSQVLQAYEEAEESVAVPMSDEGTTAIAEKYYSRDSFETLRS